jgi:hypothetical protein
MKVEEVSYDFDFLDADELILFSNSPLHVVINAYYIHNVTQ